MNKNLKNTDREIKAIVEQSSSSFFIAMKLLPKRQKRAIYSVYSFCRVIDDIVDEGDNSIDKKTKMLNFWRDEINNIYNGGIPQTSVSEAILHSLKNGFRFPKDEFLKIIDGVGMDIPNPINRPSYEKLLEYCRGVAVAPGILCMHAFGFYKIQEIDIAKPMGNALQITNILRDTKEDALIGRCYIPDEYLKKADIESKDTKDILINNKLYIARQELAIRALEFYDASYKKLAKLDKKKAKPVKLILELYKEYYEIMKNRGWEAVTPKPRLRKRKKLALAFKIFILGK